MTLPLLKPCRRSGTCDASQGRRCLGIALWWAIASVAACCSADDGLETAKLPVTWTKVSHVGITRANGAEASAGDRLLISDDGGRTWTIGEGRSPDGDFWEAQFSHDGCFWLAVRSVNARHQLISPEHVLPECIMIVDTVAPRLKFELTETDDHTIVGKISAADANLLPASLRYSAWSESPDGTRQSCQPSEVLIDPSAGRLSGSIIWLPKSPGRFVARVAVSDGAQHEVQQTRAIEASEPDSGPRLIPESRSEPPRLRLVTAEVPPAVSATPAPAKAPPPQLVPVFPDGTNTDAAATASPSAPDVAEELPPPSQDVEPRDDAAAREPTVAPSGELGPERMRIDLLLRAARNAVALHDIPEALSRFEELLELAPQDHQARFEYAGLLLQAERYPQARKQLEILVGQRGRMADYRLTFADLLLRLKEFDAAREQLTELIKDPRFARQGRSA